MPIKTNLNVSPYFDDYDPTKDFYKILFKPGVSVQTRELNQFQTILQTQIERFGDNILKKGTIIDGCNFNFNNAQAYVKILDAETDGTTAIPALYVRNFVKNSANLTGFIVNFADGFESTDPDLKTIYLNYINSGNDANTKQFSAGETLTIYDPNNSVYKVVVNDGGINFSNNDTVVFTSKVAVRLSSGSFNVGDHIIDTSFGGVANLEIIEVDNLSLADFGQVLLGIKPRTQDLTVESANSSFWTLPLNATITNQTTTVTGVVENIYGVNAQGRVVTKATGEVESIAILNRGSGYEFPPHVSIRSINNPLGLATLDLTGQNFVAKVKVSSAIDAVGNGYTFSVGEGIVYQKGYFQRVAPQTVIVEKYNTNPNNVVVGFSTVEDIVDSNEDTSLLDNATGSPNETAPGADRLKLTPQLEVLDKDVAAANNEFFVLVEWNEGNPYKQNQTTVYNRIGDEIASSTYDQAGNFVLDQFQVITKSTSNAQNEGKVYTAVVDPGMAYISGYKVQTLNNFQIDIKKGTDTKVANNVISLNYGNYVYVKELGGNWLYSVGASVDLYDLSKGFISNTTLISSGNTSPLGKKIGTAKIRSLIHDRETPGTANAVYRMYLFDIRMDAGQNFNKTRSIYYNGTFKGISDIVLDSGIAKLYGTLEDGLLFPAGVESLKNSNNTNYTYRTIDQNAATSNNGLLTKSIATIPNEYFVSQGNLSFSELRNLYVVPVANDLIQSANLDGLISINTTSTNVTGTGTKFDLSFSEGDYLIANNGAGEQIKRVVKIFSNTLLQVDSVFVSTNTAARYTRVFPKNVPVPFGSRTGLSANVDTNRKILTLKYAHSNGQQITFRGTTSVNTALGYNVRRENVTSSTKTANRKQFVKIRIANNSGGVGGPWCLGVPDIFRLRNVYVGQSVNVNTASPSITDRCYIDHNQNPNYYGLGYLYLKPNSKMKMSSSDFLLVEFDYFTRDAEGYYDTVSYLKTSDAESIANLDSTPLSGLSTAASSWEVPEIYTYNNQYYDLLNQFDFRPAVAATATPSLSHSVAPLNPTATESFNTTDDKKFPLPDSQCSTLIEQYLGRVDDIYIGERGNIYVLQGIPDVNPRNRYNSNHPKDSLKLQILSVPAYPNLSQVLSQEVAEILNTSIANEKNLNLRARTHVVMPIMTSAAQQASQPMVYTMEDIGNLERRIKDLEYYVSLSVLETNITNKVIPSSVDPSLNRFKFGFFADDFSTDTYSDFDNPQYAASIEVEGDVDFGFFGSPTEPNLPSSDKMNPISTLTAGPTPITQKKTNRVVPPKHLWNLKHTPDNLTYVDSLVIEQKNATVTANVCVPNLVTINTYSTTNSYYYSQQTNPRGKEQKTDVITFGNTSGAVTMFFFSYGAPDRYRIYQGNTLIAGSDVSLNQVVNLTAADKAFLTSNSNATTWYNLYQKPNLDQTWTRGSAPYQDFVRNAGKIQFNHNPASGLTYTVVVDKGPGSVVWKYLIEYPGANTLVSSTIIDVANCGGPPILPVYPGTLNVRGITAWSCSSQFKINNTTYTAFVVECTGLKPKTIHKFFLDGVEQTNVAPRTFGSSTGVGGGFNLSQGTLGKPLITDAQGKVAFTVYVPINALPWIINQLGLTGGIYQDKSTPKMTQGSSGYSKLTVSDGGVSVAEKVVANRAPDKALPHDPRGNI